MAKRIEENTIIDKKDLKEIKIELLDYAKDRIGIEVENSFKKIEKKIVKRKNIKIIKRDITIIILLTLICFMTYELYNIGYFNKYLVKDTTTIKEVEEENETSTISEEQDKVMKEDLKEKHQHALDNISIKHNSKYLNDYYNGNLTNELKLELTLNTVPTEEIEIDEDTFIINNTIMEEYYNKLFDLSYQASSFNYGSNKIKYLKNQELYLTSSEITKSTSKIKRIITDINEDNNEIIVRTIEYIVDNDKVINILSKEEITENENNVLKVKDKLNKLEYHLTNKDSIYKLKSIKQID